MNLEQVIQRLENGATLAENIVGKVEHKYPGAFVELHGVPDNKYWVGYLHALRKATKDLRRVNNSYRKGYKDGFGRCLALFIGYQKRFNVKNGRTLLNDIKRFILSFRPIEGKTLG